MHVENNPRMVVAKKTFMVYIYGRPAYLPNACS